MVLCLAALLNDDERSYWEEIPILAEWRTRQLNQRDAC